MRTGTEGATLPWATAIAQNRHTALHALAQTQLLGSGGQTREPHGGCAIVGGGDTSNASAAETLSDSLSADTPFAWSSIPRRKTGASKLHYPNSLGQNNTLPVGRPE